MKKGILLALIIFTMFLQAFPAPVLAEEETAEDIPSASLRFARAMGILNAGKKGGDAITRLELAESYYRIIMEGEEQDPSAPTRFEDVPGSGAVQLISQSGIMNGTGETTFSPNDSVTYIQLLKTMVSFLGYDVVARNAGGYPYGYLSAGTQLRLTAAGAQPEEPVTADMVAVMFRKAAEADIMQRVSVGETITYETSRGQTYLNLYLDVAKHTGVVTGNSVTSLENSAKLKYSQVSLDGEVFYVEDTALDIKSKLGYRVDAYVKELEDGELSILYYEEKNNEVVTVKDSEISGVQGYKISYSKGGSGKKDTISLNVATYVVYNGSLCTSYDESILNPFAGTTKDGYLRAIDNNDDGICDLVEICAYDTYVVKKVIDNVIFNKYNSAEVIDLGDFKPGEIEIVNIMGEPLRFSDIAENDVISVERDQVGKVKRITVTIDKIVGTVKSVDWSQLEISLGDTVYECSNSIRSNPDIEKLKVGVKGRFYFNRDGRISDFELGEYEEYSMAFLVDAGSTGAITGEYQVKLFDAGGEFVVCDLAEKISVAGAKLSAAAAIQKAGEVDGRVKRQIIRYQQNENKEIDYLEFCDLTNDGTRDGLYQYAGFDGIAPRPLYKSSIMSFSGKLLISTGTTIYKVPTEENRDDEELYSIETANYFPNDDTGKLFQAFGAKKNSPFAEALVVVNDESKEISEDINIILVDKIVEAVNEDGVTLQKIIGIIDGKQGEIFAQDDTLNIRPVMYPAPEDSSQQTYTAPRKGDVIRALSNKKGEIYYAEYVFDNERENMYYQMSTTSKANDRTANPSGGFGDKTRFVYGEVIYYDGAAVTIEIKSYNETVSYESYPVTKFSLLEFDKDTGKDGNIRLSASERIRDREYYPGHSSKVLIQLRRGDPKSIVIYNGGEAE